MLLNKSLINFMSVYIYTNNLIIKLTKHLFLTSILNKYDNAYYNSFSEKQKYNQYNNITTNMFL